MVRAVSKWCKRGLGVCCASHSSGWPVPVMQVVALCRAAGPPVAGGGSAVALGVVGTAFGGAAVTVDDGECVRGGRPVRPLHCL